MAVSRRHSVSLRSVCIFGWSRKKRENRPFSSILSPRSALAQEASCLLAAAFCVGLSACDLVFDSDVKQCEVDQDCLERGFEDSVCVAEVCQPASDAGFTPSEAGIVSSGADRDASIDATSQDGLDSAAPGLAAPDATSAGTADSSKPMAGTDAGTKPIESGGADSGGPCEGARCAQCQRNEDCEALGMKGASCADGLCWSAQPDCKVDADCVARGPEYQGGKCFESQCRPNPRFRCERPSVEGNFMPVQLSTLVRDSLSLSPLQKIAAKVCQKLDLECATPVAEAMTGTDGILRFTVPANFSGYLRVEAATYMPAIYAIPTVLPKDGVLQPFPLLGSGIIADALALTLGSRLDRTRGHMMLISEDCFGMALTGVSFTSPQKDARTVQFYVRDLLPSTSATSTGEVGNGGYLNFPAGTAVITVTENPRSLRLATVSIVVKPGFVTVSYIRPDPR